MKTEILEKIQDLFFKKLDEKTGWGKNDIKTLYKDCVMQVIMNELQNLKTEI